MKHSTIISGEIFHKRFLPKSHSFKFSHHMLLKNLSSTKKLPKLFTFFFNIQNKHYLDSSDDKIIDKLKLKFSGTELNSSNTFWMLSAPSFLGYTFNPASFYFSVNSENDVEEILVEVHNTFSESHHYHLTKENLINVNPLRFLSPKEFHVSPFFSREGNYEFTFKISEKMIFIQIDLYQEDTKVISTSYSGKFENQKSLNSFLNIIKLIFSISKTELRILIQAYKLKFKIKIPYVPKPDKINGNLQSTARGIISRLKLPF